MASVESEPGTRRHVPSAGPTPFQDTGSNGTGQCLLERGRRVDKAQTYTLHDPICHGMQELQGAKEKRTWVSHYLARARSSNTLPSPTSGGKNKDESFSQSQLSPADDSSVDSTTPLFYHLSLGLALTLGSALGSTPPLTSACLESFLLPNKAGLTAGARAWTKHAHRSDSQPRNPTEPAAIDDVDEASEPLGSPGSGARQKVQKKKKSARDTSQGWWGRPSGPVKIINERAVELFWRIVENATWRNLHWLPHEVLVYEVRVAEGYGMRWSQDQGSSGRGEVDTPVAAEADEVGLREEVDSSSAKPWIFRGFVEPMMENGHEVGWKH